MERESRLQTQEQLHSRAERGGKDLLLWEMKQSVASAVGPESTGSLGWLGHEVSGHCRDSQGTKGGAEDETIHFPLG